MLKIYYIKNLFNMNLTKSLKKKHICDNSNILHNRSLRKIHSVTKIKLKFPDKTENYQNGENSTADLARTKKPAFTHSTVVR